MISLAFAMCISYKVFMEIKIPKDVRQHKETIFFGLSARQFLCALSAVGIAVTVYLGLSGSAGQEIAGWACILSAGPVAAAGFFQYNGLTLEQFLWAVLKSQALCAGKRVFRAENIYYKALGRREDKDFD